MLTHCLEQDSTFSDAHLLMAQVILYFTEWQHYVVPNASVDEIR